MNNQASKTYGQPEVGCYLDQSYRNADEHNAATVELAQGFGWELDSDAAEIMQRWQDVDSDDERGNGPDFDLSELLNELADEAIDWLNGQETRTGLYWANDGDAGAFGLWVGDIEEVKESVGFVSCDSMRTADSLGYEASDSDPAYPADSFRGEWLHVSDHGNCTLYVRESADNADGYIDRELWGIV